VQLTRCAARQPDPCASHSPPSPDDLAAIAAEWKVFGAELDDPMPVEIEMFVRRYSAT
jgi:hypothetical protein